ncbi:10884_t:CDS:2, partial [Racocetra persica]
MSVDNVVKVANISSLVTEPILKQLFEFLGDVTKIKLYNSPHGDGVQECTIEFKEAYSAITALHLTGVELGDRTLMVSSTTAPSGIPFNSSYQQQIISSQMLPQNLSPPRSLQSKSAQKPLVTPITVQPFSINSLA